MYTNVVQHFKCQPQDNFSTLNITLMYHQLASASTMIVCVAFKIDFFCVLKGK